ncbi:sodium-coupled monocarboxylate transporter 1-like [Dreissena polymorpha]|uniref:sodium-coupled monocarboxylate transporter 1-like n=1 Tax=Dreissena polymorpha TaxID=45954 RepID=UPI0022644ACF|nr:sodium-coupled monocarboxylate transporter 1-like [Dreissena polymorpha]
MDNYLRPADVAVLCGGILASLVVGVVYAVKESRHESSSFRYHRGGGKLHPVPVAVSLVVTFESSISYLGLPSEIYMYGSYYAMLITGLIAGYLMMFFITIPLFYPLQITSVYEYLQMRHESQRVRQMSMWLGNVGSFLYAGIVTFGAATGMEGVTGVSAWIYIVVLTSIAVVYTSLGGIKAVVVTDVVQGVIMIGMIFSILVYGCIRVGGVSTVIEINRPTGRLQIFDFDPNPYKRHTFWTLAIGNGWMCAGIIFSPPLVQRLNSVRSIGDARKVAAMSIPAFVILQILIMCEGLVAYAYFSLKGCDPIASKQISNPNQIIPYLVRDLFASVPGITGLYLSALCSASLSTISSLLSSISAVTSEDFIRPRLKKASEKKLTQLSKLIVVMAGVVSIGIAILISQVKGPMGQISGSILGAVNAPIAVVFFLSIFVRCTTRRGLYSSVIVGACFAMWLSLGSNFSPGRLQPAILPLGHTDKCFSYHNTSRQHDLPSKPQLDNDT